MSKMLERAIEKILQQPEEVQDLAAEQLMVYVDQIPTLRDRVALSEGQEAYRRGEFISLDQWRHDLELGDR